MKKTILFSSVIGDIDSIDEECSFNGGTISLLQSAIKPNQNLVFINAPMFINDELYFDKILKCFEKIGITFASAIEITDISKTSELSSFPQNRVYFLMDGNPITQYGLLKKYNLLDELKNYEGTVIGFGAGAINLSKHSIVTSNEDFEEALYYESVGRVDITVEPHFYLDDSEFTKNRIEEINKFCFLLNTEIYALPDSSAIEVLDDSVGFYGENYKYF